MVSRDHSTALIIATLGCAVGLGVSSARLSAQVSADILQKYKADLEKQTTDPDQKREGGTQPRDWSYDLPAGVTTRQVTFFVDGGTALYGKMFFPRDFSMRGRWPAVVVGRVDPGRGLVPQVPGRRAGHALVGAAGVAHAPPTLGSGPDALLTAIPASAQVGKDIEFFSEGVVCHGRMFVPGGFSPASKAAGVVLAPGAGDTASSIESYGARLAAQGIVALVIDYRGWGRSGAFLYLVELIRWDDRLRFSQHTAKVRMRRKRLVPDAQITDIRNAITYLQGEPGVDRARIGVWGADLAGGHVVSVAAMDARVKAAVAQVPVIAGKDQARAAWKPTAAEQADLVRLARSGPPSVTAATAATTNDPEARLALAQYRPFQALDAIPPTTAVLFVVAEKDTV